MQMRYPVPVPFFMDCRMRRPLCLIVLLLIALAAGGPGAQQTPDPLQQVLATNGDMSSEHGGWAAFGDVGFILDKAIVLLFALAMSALIAYHPMMRRKASSLEDLDRPKVFLFYGLVAAVVSIIVKEQPSMALVIFGIGGLLRFRSIVGQGKDTGQVILVTIVGLCSGLELFVVAALATAFGWVLMLVLERERSLRLLVKAVDPSRMPAATATYSKLLKDAGCRILGERKIPVKHTFVFDLCLPADVSREKIEEVLATVPEELRGAIDWQVM